MLRMAFPAQGFNELQSGVSRAQSMGISIVEDNGLWMHSIAFHPL